MKKEIKKLSVEHCRKLIGDASKKYSDSEILQIRDYLYSLAEIEYSIIASCSLPDSTVTQLKNAA
jgi:hypothetical protein